MGAALPQLPDVVEVLLFHALALFARAVRTTNNCISLCHDDSKLGPPRTGLLHARLSFSLAHVKLRSAQSACVCIYIYV